MSIFDEAKPRTGASESKKRTRVVSRAVRKLLDKRNEQEFVKGLEEDFGINREHPKFKEMMAIWRNANSS